MDNELQQIIDKAFIYESCPQKRAHSQWRKEQLTKRLIAYIGKQLSNQFNAKSLQSSDKYRLGQGENGREQMQEM